jgi:SAM-dependent methyltransferase
MTQTRSSEQVRAHVHGMWASVAASWGANADDIDQRAAPITACMLDAVAVDTGDRVLELASGPGGTGLAAASRVGPSGEVVISDVVADMASIARQRAAARGFTNVRAEVLDLENIAEPDEAYDVVLCREGMMFALDPARAAAEMHRVLRPAGRASVAVWASRQDNPWLGVLLDTITQVTGIDVPPPGIPGPFTLCDASGLHQLFAGAGFTGLTLDHVAAPLRSPSFEAWWTRNLTVAGPAANILNKLDNATRFRLRDTVRAAVTRYESNGALELPGLAVVVTGRRP